jgi:hypothetical protein
VYPGPVPNGFVATTIEIPPTFGLRVGAPVYPASEAYDMPALGMRFNVFTGTLDIAIPVTLNAELVKLGHAHEVDTVRINLTLSYQACNDTICVPPRTIQLTLDAPVGDVILPAGIHVYVERVMNGAKKA